MNDIEHVIDKLIKGQIFFFSGSGISYASNLPSAYSILKHTVNVFLPADVSDQIKNDICNIQPEVFYELLISMTRSYECLDMWRSLYSKDQKQHNVQCSPNKSHLFIVEYSYKNRLPVITTNFDSMFEQACEQLNLKYQIILPTEAPPNTDADILYICKIHGTIQDNKGLYSPHALWTTMTEITKVNTEWIEYLYSLMLKKHLCFVGYSGKDIDLFPHISEFPKKGNTKQIIWVNIFEGDHSDIASKSCKALRICEWPSDFFEKVATQVGVQSVYENYEEINDLKSVEILLHVLRRSLIEKQLLSIFEKKLFYCSLLAKIGRYRKAHRYALALISNKYIYLEGTSKYFLLLSCSKLSHEISKYESCRKYAKEVLTIMKNKGEYDVNSIVQAKCLISEAYRMSIPNDIYFNQKKSIFYYFYAAFVLTHFMFIRLCIKVILYRHKLKFSDLYIESQHELIEHQVRQYALLQSITGSPLVGWNIFVKTFLTKKWDNIRKLSYNAGYSAGIANAGKFRYRLTPSDEINSESSNIYLLTTSSTGTELLIKNKADQFLCNGQLDESKRAFKEYANIAKKSGNVLNEIKGIIGVAYVNKLKNKHPLLTEKLYRRLLVLIDQVEGKLWEKYFYHLIENIRT